MKLPATVVAATSAATLVLSPSADGHAGCNSDACHQRVDRRQAKALKRQVVAPHRGWLLRVASCESGRRWHIATGNGFYGGLQFTLSSWHAVGGRGYPHHHGRLEQMYRAVKLLRLQGPGAWPVCSQRA